MPDESESKPVVGDLAGVGKVADSKLANKFYDDALAPLMRQLGEISEDVAKTGRLIFFPLRMLATRWDHVGKWIEEVADGVPEERRQEASPSISGPILNDLLQTEDGNPLVQLYLELLKRAIDKERCHEAHPSYHDIIKQLAPEEALMLWMMRNPKRNDEGREHFQFSSEDFNLLQKQEVEGFAIHLDSLRLVTIYVATGHGYVAYPHQMRVTSFGRMFIKACIPDDFTLPTKSDK